MWCKTRGVDWEFDIQFSGPINRSVCRGFSSYLFGKPEREGKDGTKRVPEAIQDGAQGYVLLCFSSAVCGCDCRLMLVWVFRSFGGRNERHIQ